MLNEPTIEKLYALRLGTMAEAWQTQQSTPKLSELSFDERFAMLVDAEHTARKDRKVTRLLKQAGLRLPEASLENVAAGASRGVRAHERDGPRDHGHRLRLRVPVDAAVADHERVVERDGAEGEQPLLLVLGELHPGFGDLQRRALRRPTRPNRRG